MRPATPPAAALRDRRLQDELARRARRGADRLALPARRRSRPRCSARTTACRRCSTPSRCTATCAGGCRGYDPDRAPRRRAVPVRARDGRARHAGGRRRAVRRVRVAAARRRSSSALSDVLDGGGRRERRGRPVRRPPRAVAATGLLRDVQRRGRARRGRRPRRAAPGGAGRRATTSGRARRRARRARPAARPRLRRPRDDPRRRRRSTPRSRSTSPRCRGPRPVAWTARSRRARSSRRRGRRGRTAAAPRRARRSTSTATGARSARSPPTCTALAGAAPQHVDDARCSAGRRPAVRRATDDAGSALAAAAAVLRGSPSSPAAPAPARRRPSRGSSRCSPSRPRGRGAAAARRARRADRQGRGAPGGGGPRGGARARRQRRGPRASSLGAATPRRCTGCWAGAPTATAASATTATNRLPHDVVIVDETSMVSLSLMARLVEAVRPDARLVLVGDPGQLDLDRGRARCSATSSGRRRRPADATRARSRLAGSPASSAATIRRRTARSATGSSCSTASTATARDRRGRRRHPPRRRRRDVAALAAGAEDVTWIDADAAEHRRVRRCGRARRRGRAARDVIEAARAGDARAALDGARRPSALLCAHRRGTYGVATWMARVERWLAAALAGFAAEGALVRRPPAARDRERLRPAALQRRHGRGRRRRGRPRERGVRAPRRGGRSSRPPGSDAVETVYAMTIHKSQGSQFGTAAVLLPDADVTASSRASCSTRRSRGRGASSCSSDPRRPSARPWRDRSRARRGCVAAVGHGRTVTPGHLASADRA